MASAINISLRHGAAVVQFSSGYLREFAGTWPCSGMGAANRPLTFTLADNGDLVDIQGERAFYEPGAVGALADTAKMLYRSML